MPAFAAPTLRIVLVRSRRVATLCPNSCRRVQRRGRPPRRDARSPRGIRAASSPPLRRARSSCAWPSASPARRSPSRRSPHAPGKTPAVGGGIVGCSPRTLSPRRRRPLPAAVPRCRLRGARRRRGRCARAATRSPRRETRRSSQRFAPAPRRTPLRPLVDAPQVQPPARRDGRAALAVPPGGHELAARGARHRPARTRHRARPGVDQPTAHPRRPREPLPFPLTVLDKRRLASMLVSIYQQKGGARRKERRPVLPRPRRLEITPLASPRSSLASRGPGRGLGLGPSTRCAQYAFEVVVPAAFSPTTAALGDRSVRQTVPHAPRCDHARTSAVHRSLGEIGMSDPGDNTLH